MNGPTARFAIDSLRPQPGQALAVTGAAGAFGGNGPDRELVEQRGADIVLSRGDDFTDPVRDRHPDGVDGLADGALFNAAALPAVKASGRMATVRGYTGREQDRVIVIPIWVFDHAHEWEALNRLREQVEDVTLTLHVADVLPASDAA